MLHGAEPGKSELDHCLSIQQTKHRFAAVERGWLSQMRRHLRIPSQSIHLAPHFLGMPQKQEGPLVFAAVATGPGRLPCAARMPRRHTRCEQMISQPLFEACESEAVPSSREQYHVDTRISAHTHILG